MDSTKMTARALAICGILYTLMTGSALSARDAGMAVLPFRITGATDPIYFPTAELPVLFQEATHFLFENSRDHSLQPVSETARAVERAGYKPDMRLDEKRAAALCLETDAAHLFAGTINFLPEKRLVMEAVTFSCATRNVVGRGRQTSSIAGMQKGIRDVIAEAAPFTRPLSPFDSSPARDTSDTVLLIDFSGSMVYDIGTLSKALAATKDRSPAASRMGAVILEDGGRKEVIPLSRDWSNVIRTVQKKKPAGEVSQSDLERSIAVVEEFREWKGRRKLLIFSDAPVQGRMTGIESRLRRLRAKGVEITLFCLSGQDQETRMEWTRLARGLQSPDPAVVYGRRAGFLEGFSVYLVMSGTRFYRSDKDVTGEIEHNRLRTEDLLGIETVRFEKNSLNMNDLPKKYAEAERLRLAGLGRVVSGLEHRVTSIILDGTAGASGGTRVLLRNEGKSFWIGTEDAVTVKALSANAGQSIYVGLSVRSDAKSAERIANDPARVYLKGQGKVPRLLVNTWANLAGSGAVNADDIWFLLCEIKEVRSANETHDIRE